MEKEKFIQFAVKDRQIMVTTIFIGLLNIAATAICIWWYDYLLAAGVFTFFCIPIAITWYKRKQDWKRLNR